MENSINWSMVSLLAPDYGVSPASDVVRFAASVRMASADVTAGLVRYLYLKKNVFLICTLLVPLTQIL